MFPCPTVEEERGKNAILEKEYNLIPRQVVFLLFKL